jgi:hypothetical protein
MSEESKAIREEASKTRLLIIRITVLVLVVAALFVGCQEMKAAETRIQDHTESIMDQVAP